MDGISYRICLDKNLCPLKFQECLMACCNLRNVAWGHAWEACSHLKLPGTDSLPLSGMLPTPQLFNTLYLQASLHCAELMPMVFRRSTFQCCASFHIQLLSTSPETARVARNCESHSFIICVCLGVQHLKLI